jgi:hypothetical protein
MGGLGLVAGAAAHWMGSLGVPFAGVPEGIIGGIVGVAVGAAVAHRAMAGRLALGMLALVPMLVSSTWAAVAISAALLAMSLCVGTTGWVRRATLVLGTAVSIVAAWVAIKISFSAQTQQWSGLAVDSVAAGAFAMLGAVTMLPRHVRWQRDVVAAAFAALPASIDAEVLGLCKQCVTLWQSNQAAMQADDSNRVLLQDGVLAVLEGAAHDGAATVGSDDTITKRMTELDVRISNASDDETRTQYQSAKQALVEQQEFRAKHKVQRDRLVAKLHHQVAALERFQMAAHTHRLNKPLMGRLADGVDRNPVDAALEVASDQQHLIEATSEVEQALR